jgi:hypothetical protein
MTDDRSNQIRQADFLSSNLVQGFDRVTISTAAKCSCGTQIRPHDVHLRDEAIEIICDACHKTFIAVELAEIDEDDEDGDDE